MWNNNEINWKVIRQSRSHLIHHGWLHVHPCVTASCCFPVSLWYSDATKTSQQNESCACSQCWKRWSVSELKGKGQAGPGFLVLAGSMQWVILGHHLCVSGKCVSENDIYTQPQLLSDRYTFCKINDWQWSGLHLISAFFKQARFTPSLSQVILNWYELILIHMSRFCLKSVWDAQDWRIFYGIF